MQSEMTAAMGEDGDPSKLPFFGGSNQKQEKRVAKWVGHLACFVSVAVSVL